MATAKSAKELIKSAHKQRRSTRVNLRGDLRAEVDRLEMQLGDLREAGPKPQRMTDKAPAVKIAEQIEKLRTQMSGAWLDIVLEQQSWAEWRKFRAEHPAREDEEYDKLVGVDFDALLTVFTPKCVVEPELDAEDWEGIFEKVSPGDLRDLAGVAYALHETGMREVPKSRAASVAMRLSGEVSEQLEPGE